jgi:nucleoside diphosphate kinase
MLAAVPPPPDVAAAAAAAAVWVSLTRALGVVSNAAQYEGNWAKDKRHGFGSYTYANGDVYTGEWASGAKAGTGKYTGPAELAGSWKDGKLSSGEWIFPDGSCYKGEFADGKPTGFGKFVLSSGNAQTGTFSALVTDEEGAITGGEWTPASEVEPAFAADLATTVVSDPAPAPIEQTYAMIKPNAVAAGATEAILDAARAAGFKVVAKETASLTTAQAEEFYGEHAGKSFFGDLVSFMTSGPIVKLILEKEGAILGWRALLGPTNSLTAKTEAPESLRALYGIDGTQNAAHGSDSPESAAREIGLMLPTNSTLAIIAPHPNTEHEPNNAAGEAKAIQMLKAAGFTVSCAPMPISASEVVTVTGLPAEGLLAAPEEEGGAESMLTKLVLTAPSAIATALSMELKAELAVCYFSPDAEKAAADIDAVFPMEKTVALIKPAANSSSKDQIMAEIADAGLTVVKEEEATMTPGAAKVFYSAHKEADFYEELCESMVRTVPYIHLSIHLFIYRSSTIYYRKTTDHVAHDIDLPAVAVLPCLSLLPLCWILHSDCVSGGAAVCVCVCVLDNRSHPAR